MDDLPSEEFERDESEGQDRVVARSPSFVQPQSPPSGKVRRVQASMHHVGPMPAPIILREYKQIDPELPIVIRESYREEGQIRQANETMLVKAEVEATRRGQDYGLIVTLAFLVGSLLCILTGHDVAGGVLGTVDLVALVSVFVLSPRQRHANDDQ